MEKIYKDYREFILEEYERRKAKNCYYSLRAFSRDLGISASTLTEILNHKHSISDRTANKILSKINLTHKEQSLFEWLINLERIQNKKNKDLTGYELFVDVPDKDYTEFVSELDQTIENVFGPYDLSRKQVGVSLQELLFERCVEYFLKKESTKEL